MLNVFGGRFGTCDGVSRRSFLRVGALGLAGLALPDVLKARALATKDGTAKNTAVIQVFLSGGPTHLETYDLKPDAPKEFRGDFKPIPTKLAGVQLSEYFPRQAQVMDKIAVIRSLHHDSADHGIGSHWTMTGFPSSSSFMPAPTTGPASGSIAARMRGPNAPGLPPYVSMPKHAHVRKRLVPGRRLQTRSTWDGDPHTTASACATWTWPGGLSMARLEDRRYLLEKLDNMERQSATPPARWTASTTSPRRRMRW